MAKIKELTLSTPQGTSGVLSHASRYVFNYTTPDRDRETSLTMPIRPESYSDGRLPTVFEMNRPEGYLLDRIRQRFAKEGGLDDMGLLWITGGNQIGRLRYHLSGGKVEVAKPQIGLSEILIQKPSENLFEFLVDTYFASGISGVQPKVMLPDADKADTSALATRATLALSDLIVKAGDDDHPCLAENEFLCMDAARRAGIEVPRFWLSDGGLFIMERFDVRDGVQYGFEDMAVLMAKHAEHKYEGSYEGIVKAIHLYCRENAPDASRKFFEYLTLSVMTRNGDAHLKNFGLIYESPMSQSPPKLAPLYDVVTTSVYEVTNERTGISVSDRTLALKLNKERNYPSRERLIAFGRNVCGVANPGGAIDQIAEAMSATLIEHSPRIPREFLGKLKAEWEAGTASLMPPRIFGNPSMTVRENEP